MDKDKDEKEEDAPEATDGYKVAEKATVADLMDKDKDDEALQKYKAELLGDGKNTIIDEKDKRQVFFDQLVIEPEGQDRIVIKFRVQREIVLGLKKFTVLKRKGIKVDKSTDMMGSYAPDAEKVNVYNFPFDVVPDGMLARGTYVARTQFIDDDKTVHCDFSYSFKIAKTQFIDDDKTV